MADVLTIHGAKVEPVDAAAPCMNLVTYLRGVADMLERGVIHHDKCVMILSGATQTTVQPINLSQLEAIGLAAVAHNALIRSTT